MYVSILPISLFFYGLWTPPQLDQTGLFIYLTFMTVGLRLTLTPFSVPFNAMVPDITSDYDERTHLLNYTVSGAWLFGGFMTMAMFWYWLADTPGTPSGSGLLNVQGYVDAGTVVAVIIFGFLTLAAVGTHGHIPYLNTAAHKPMNLKIVLGELKQTLNDRSLFAMLISGIFGAAAGGTGATLWIYIQSYFWEFTSQQNGILAASQTLSVMVALSLLGRLTQQKEKKRVLIQLTILSMLVTTGPIYLRLSGFFPGNHTDLLFYVMVAFGIAWVSLLIMIAVLTGSMITDLVESRELETGRREEGVLLAANSFVEKVSGGIGVWAGGIALAVISFPLNVDVSSVTPETIENLGWTYASILVVLYAISIGAVTFYTLDRSQHEENVRQLAIRQVE